MLAGKVIKYLVCICLLPIGLRAQTDIVKTRDDIHWDAINRHRDQMERGGNIAHDYATCGAIFPVEIGKSKKIVLSGYIKTADLTSGWAGLWWHIDRKNNIYDIRGMSLTGPSGTTDWKQFSITIQAKKDARVMDFGCIVTGDGKAWFDNLSIEIDGINYNEYATLMGIPKESMPFLNLDFETLSADKKLAVWSIHGGDDYVVRIDSNIKYSGKYSVMIGLKTLEPREPSHDTITKPDTKVIAAIPSYAFNPDSVKMFLKKSNSGFSEWILYIETTARISVGIFSADKTKLLIHKDDSKTIDVTALPNGIYNVEIYDDKGTLLKASRLVKQIEQ